MYLLLFNLALWVLVVVCGSSSLTRDQTQTPCSGSAESATGLQECPQEASLREPKTKRLETATLRTLYTLLFPHISYFVILNLFP